MGLGFGLILSRTGALSFLKSAPVASDIAKQFFEIASRQKPLGRLAYAREPWTGGRNVCLLPTEEDVEFRQDGANVIISARTSSLGPGYHDYLVELVDRLITTSGLKARETDDWSDETNYFSTRDFDALQEAMSEHFSALCGIVREQAATGAEQIRLGMPVENAPVLKDAFALTARGPRGREFFEDGKPEDYFGWWEKGLTAESIPSLIDTLLWSEFPWRAPITEADSNLQAVIGDLFALAGQGESQIRAAFDAARISEAPPSSAGVGYRKGDYAVMLPGGWMITVPGYFAVEVTDSFDFWFGERAIYASVLTVSKAEPGRPELAADANKPIYEDINGVLYAGDFEPSDDGSGNWRLTGTAAEINSVVICSITCPSQDDREWAKGILLSIRRPNRGDNQEGG